MYAYAKDVALKNAPEDFVYHVPRDVTYTATYIDYTIDKNYRVVGESRPRRGIYFQHYRDGSAGAYCTGVAGLCSLDEEEWCEVPVGAAVVFAPSFGVAEFLVFSLPVVWGVAVCFGAAVCVVPVVWEVLPTRPAVEAAGVGAA